MSTGSLLLNRPLRLPMNTLGIIDHPCKAAKSTPMRLMCERISSMTSGSLILKIKMSFLLVRLLIRLRYHPKSNKN
jgi:hypothetical protein